MSLVFLNTGWIVHLSYFWEAPRSGLEFLVFRKYLHTNILQLFETISMGKGSGVWCRGQHNTWYYVKKKCWIVVHNKIYLFHFPTRILNLVKLVCSSVHCSIVASLTSDLFFIVHLRCVWMEACQNVSEYLFKHIILHVDWKNNISQSEVKRNADISQGLNNTHTELEKRF